MPALRVTGCGQPGRVIGVAAVPPCLVGDGRSRVLGCAMPVLWSCLRSRVFCLKGHGEGDPRPRRVATRARENTHSLHLSIILGGRGLEPLENIWALRRINSSI